MRGSLKEIVNEEENRQQSCLATCRQFLYRFNPCLRPEKQSEQLTRYLQKFSQLSVYQDPYYGECCLIQSLNLSELLVLKKEKHPEANAQERQKKLRQLQSFNGNVNIINENLIDKIHKIGFLWTSYEFYTTYDYILVDLQKQFNFRKQKGKKFTQNQVCNIMKGACKGLIHLQTTDYASVRMSHIYFSKDGIVKVAHPQLFNYQTNLALLCENDESEGLYLSPEEMKCLERGDKDAILGWKSNSFVFGMVLISLMRLRPLKHIYDYSSCEINKKRLEESISHCKDDYSQRLVNIIEKMVIQRVQDRMTLRSALNKLSYKQDARNKVDLELMEEEKKKDAYDYRIDYIPQKQPEYVNHLKGLVFPKVGRTGQFYYEEEQTDKYTYHPRQSENDEIVVAQQRHFYQNRNSQYVGSGSMMGKSKYIAEEEKMQKPIRQGKGVYKNDDGQLYIGDWKKGEMDGYGKLFWDQHKIRYEGYFREGRFHGRGTEFNGGSAKVGHADDDDSIDETFVRMQKDNWQKYEGSFREDKRDGQGVVYFKNGRWMGNFKLGQPNGEGIFVNNKGKKFRGVWKNGILQE